MKREALEVGKTYRCPCESDDHDYTVARRFQDAHERWWVETSCGSRWYEAMGLDDEEVPAGTEGEQS